MCSNIFSNVTVQGQNMYRTATFRQLPDRGSPDLLDFAHLAAAPVRRVRPLRESDPGSQTPDPEVRRWNAGGAPRAARCGGPHRGLVSLSRMQADAVLAV